MIDKGRKTSCPAVCFVPEEGQNKIDIIGIRKSSRKACTAPVEVTRKTKRNSWIKK